MQKLDSRDYAKVIGLLEQVKINTLFAKAVLKQKVDGAVYADDVKKPQAFYVVHPYGMSLLFGDAQNDIFNGNLAAHLKDEAGRRKTAVWLQADPAGAWTGLLDSLLDTYNAAHNSKMMFKQTRVNFEFDREAYLAARSSFPGRGEPVVQMDKESFAVHEGAVLPRFFWRDEQQFLEEGIGFCVMDGNDVASAAFSAYRTKHRLEIGIETAAAYRGKGYALAVCARLIDYCLEQGLEPVWACRLENEGSYLLAQKLGFKPTLTLPYYYLPAAD